MVKLFWRAFWACYAVVYDSISHLEPYRRMMEQLCAPVARSRTVLDAGCGTGNACQHLERAGMETIVGADRSEAMLARAARKLARATLVRADLDAPLAFPDARFDAVVCCNVVYALPRPLETLCELRRVLRPDGLLVCATPRDRFRLSELIREQFRCGPRAWWVLAVNAPGLLAATLLNMVLLSRVDWTRFISSHASSSKT